MAVCVKALSTVMKRGEAALVFVAGFADIEDLHALFAELPAHCAVEAVPFHSLISPEEQVRPSSSLPLPPLPSTSSVGHAIKLTPTPPRHEPDRQEKVLSNNPNNPNIPI